MFIAEFATDNDAFAEIDHAVATASTLRGIARKIEAGKFEGVIRDANGNRIGSFRLDRD